MISSEKPAKNTAMDSNNILIKRMNSENVKAVAKIERECFLSPWSLNSLKTELENPAAVFFVALINGEIVGYAGMHHVIDEGYITNIAVLQKYRRLGAASTLLKNYFYYAENNDLRMMTLEVRESNNAARAFYEKMGFYTAGKRKSFYTKPTEDAIIMTVEFDVRGL